MLYCAYYVGLSCIDRSCPKANQDVYENSCMDSTETCEDCPYYEGCSDCTLFGTSYCPEQYPTNHNEHTDTYITTEQVVKK